MSGSQLDVHRCGLGDTRILLIHGSGSAAKPFMSLGEQLTGRLSNSEAVAVSLAGYGSIAADPQQPIIDQHLRVLMDTMADGCWHLVGHSMGGFLALRLACLIPDQVASLSLIEPMAFGMLDPERDQEAIEADRRIIRQFAETGVDSEAGIACFIETWNQSKWGNLPEGLRKQLVRLAPLIYEEASAVSFDRTGPAEYGPLNQPMLLVAGSESPLPARRIVDRLAELPAAASVQWLDGAGHMSVLREPARFASLIADHINRSAHRT